jgi:pyruvate/2-oxoglutarate/acetoin dehydrogenase E1 component
VPSTPADAKGLLASAIRDDDPVVFLEPKKLYRSLKGDVPEGDHTVPLGKVRTVREGTDATLFAWGAMIEVAEAAADALAAEGVSCQVTDIRTLSPLDEDGILEAAARTGRVTVIQEAPRRCSVASEIAALIAERGMYDLHAPIKRVTGYDVPYPYWTIEQYQRPDETRVATAVREQLA